MFCVFPFQRHESLTPTPDSEPLYMNRAALLPAYRPSPDYELVMQQRIMQQQQQINFHELTPPHLGAAQVYVHPDGMAYSQPEISQMTTGMYCRGVRFMPKMGQIGPKWKQSGTLSDHISVHFGSLSRMKNLFEFAKILIHINTSF